MQTAKCRIDAGVCGFTPEVTARCADGQTVELELSSACEHIRAPGRCPMRLNALDELCRGHESLSARSMPLLRRPRFCDVLWDIARGNVLRDSSKTAMALIYREASGGTGAGRWPS